MSYVDRVAEAEFIAECKKEDEQLKKIEESRKYEDIIARYNDTQLLYEMRIVNDEETIIYNKKKALKEELQKRTRGK